MATTKPRGRGDGRFQIDDVGESILYEGANLSQLCVMFKADHRILKEKMHGLLPCGKRNGVDIYEISEVAGRMGKLTEGQINAAMKRMNHDQLPKQLTKEYWAGLRSKQEWERKNGDLWYTSEVIEKVSEMVKSLKMELDLLTDGIERTSEMSDRQREIAKSLIDGCKLNMLKALKEKFDDKQPVADEPTLLVIDDDDEL